MENYEQHNEVSTSYNNNNLRHNFNDYKDVYSFVDVDCVDKQKEKDYYRAKHEEGQHNNGTPFLVKDILNINQTPNYSYDRNDLWKTNERDRRSYEIEIYTHQNQSYCPEYFSQPYSNVPVHTNIEPYWGPDAYNDYKFEEYYNYNPYCHNLHHQNYDQYMDMPVANQCLEVSSKDDVTEIDVVHTNTSVAPMAQDRNINDKRQLEDTNSPYPYEVPFEKLPLFSRKITSKFISFFEPSKGPYVDTIG